MRIVHSSFLLLLISPGCLDYNFGQKDKGVFDGPMDTGVLLGDTGVVVTAEECNGEDDDGDGEIDEGFTDIDFDGVADCVDENCLVEIPEASIAPSRIQRSNCFR